MFNKRALIVLIAAQIACIYAQHTDLQVSFDESFWENNLTYVANWGANITTNPTALNYYRDSIDWGTTLLGTTTVSNGVGLSVTIKSSGLSNTSPHSLRLIGLNCGTFTISIPRGFTAVSGLYGITQMPLPAASITYIYNDTSIPNVTVTLNSATYGQSFTSPSLAGPVKALAFNDASGNPCTSTLLTELILDTLVFTTSYIVPTSTVPTSQPSAPTPSSQIAPTPNNMASSSDDGLWWKVLISILGGLLLGCIGCGFLVWWQHRRADQMEHERDEEHKLRDQEKEKYLKDLEAARSAGATVPPKPGKGTSKTTLTGKSTGSQVPQRSTATASPDGKRATNTSRPATTPIPKNRDSSASPKTARRVVPPPKVVEEDSEDQEEEDDESEEEVTPKRPVRPTTLQQQQQGSKSSVNAAKSQTMPAQRPQSSPVVAKSQPSSTVRSQPVSAVRSQPASAVKPQPAKKPVPVESEEEEEEETEEEEEEESEEEQPQKRVQTMPKPSPVKQNSNLGVDPKRATYSAPASSTKGKPVKKATTAEYDV